MLKGNVLTARPADKLQDIIPKLNKVSGLPVLDADERVVGVITRKVWFMYHVQGLQAMQQVPMQLLHTASSGTSSGISWSFSCNASN